MDISHYGNFEFSITQNGNATLTSWLGRFKTTLNRPSNDSWVISVYAKKNESNFEELIVEIKLKDGSILGSKFTSDPLGEVHLSVTIEFNV